MQKYHSARFAMRIHRPFWFCLYRILGGGGGGGEGGGAIDNNYGTR